MVESHVLPRLLLRRPGALKSDRFADVLVDRVPLLLDAALKADDERSQALLHRLSRGGAGFSQLQLGLLAPTARCLNALWERDEASFVDVTIATGALQRMMRFVALDLMPSLHPRQRHKTILIAPTPGDGHGFGAAMAVEYFRRGGWTVHHEPASTPDTLAQSVATAPVDVVAFSITVRELAPQLADTVRLIRRASINPRLLVIAGGEAVSASPGLVARVGADASAGDLQHAPARIHRLVRTMFGPRG